MASDTTRDQVWALAMNRANRQQKVVTASSIAEDVGCSRRTARDTLNFMARQDFLTKRIGSDGFVRYVQTTAPIVVSD